MKFSPINSFSRSLLNLFRKNQAVESNLSIKKQYGVDTEDQFIGDLNQQLKTSLRPANRRFFQEYGKDLKHFGTRYGMIEVSNDEDIKARSEKDMRQMDLISGSMSKDNYEKIIGEEKRRIPDKDSQSIVADTFAEFKRLQVTINNNSNKDREILLWGANLEFNDITKVDYTEVELHTVVQQTIVGVFPQGISYNPVNQCIYIANQLSGNVTIMDTSNNIVGTVLLNPPLPGFNSPVALAANTNPHSIQYGYVYVAGSIANTISIIDRSFNLVGEVTIGLRPVSIAFNPVNHLVYVANMGDNTLGVFDPETSTVVRILSTGQEPLGVGVHSINGEIYVTNSLDDSVSVFSPANSPLTTITSIGIQPISATCNPVNGYMYVTATQSNQVYVIDTTHTVITTVSTGSAPYNSIFNPDNGYLYIQNRQDDTFTVLATDNSQVAVLSLGGQNIGGAYNTANHCFYISDTLNNQINVIAYDVSGAVQVDRDYEMIRTEFQSNPVIIEHARFCVTGNQRIYCFRLLHFTPTGRVRSRSMSFEQFASPEHRLNIAEVYPLSRTVIDGKTQWRFFLPAFHSVGILLWVRQFEIVEIIKTKER